MAEGRATLETGGGDQPGPANLPKTLSFVNLQQNAQRAGFLLKYERGFFKRLLGRTWQRKYCILSGYHFYWFKNKQGREKGNGVINLRYFDRCAIPADKHANIPHAFQLASSQNTDSHSFLFQADTEEEQQRWLKDIQLVIFQCQTQGRTGTVQRITTRPASRTASPVLHHRSDEDDQRRPRSSSIPDQGAAGTYRSVGQTTELPHNLTDDADVFPPEATVSRSESRNTKPDLIPRMPTYNQVVTELQSRLNSRSDDSHDQPLTGRLSARTSPVSQIPTGETTSPSSPDVGSGVSSSSVSSYDNTPEQELPSPLSLPSSADRTPEMLSPSGTSIEARFDSVLKMMEDLTDEEYASTRNGPEYAQPFAKPPDHHQGPAVAPKPKREMYEALLPSNHVGPYLVSPIVNVSG